MTVAAAATADALTGLEIDPRGIAAITGIIVLVAALAVLLTVAPAVGLLGIALALVVSSVAYVR